MIEAIFGMIILFVLRILLGYLAGFYSFLSPFLLYVTIATIVMAGIAALFIVIELVHTRRKWKEKRQVKQ